MTSLRIPFAILMLAFAPLAWGQQPVLTADVQQQMSAEQFKAAGLDKLSAKELAALNAWLQQKVTTETAVAVEKAKEGSLSVPSRCGTNSNGRTVHV